MSMGNRYYKFRDTSTGPAVVPVDESGRQIGALRTQTPSFDAADLITGFGGFASVAPVV